jgi:hypothetical protein
MCCTNFLPPEMNIDGNLQLSGETQTNCQLLSIIRTYSVGMYYYKVHLRSLVLFHRASLCLLHCEICCQAGHLHAASRCDSGNDPRHPTRDGNPSNGQPGVT